VNFVAAMVSNPEAQAKAQAEIDTVIGYATRLPTLADKQQLPYLSKLTLEVLRWLPVGPTGGAKTHIWMNILAQHVIVQQEVLHIVVLRTIPTRDTTFKKGPSCKLAYSELLCHDGRALCTFSFLTGWETFGRPSFMYLAIRHGLN
jgi:hypothetical protein